jgi:hypothetical protein
LPLKTVALSVPVAEGGTLRLLRPVGLNCYQLKVAFGLPPVKMKLLMRSRRIPSRW